MAGRVLACLLVRRADCAGLVTQSYDRISGGYDAAWTAHMRDLTAALIDRLEPKPGGAALDLTCGSGFAAGRLAEKTGGRVTGVDRSAGMLAQARANHPACEFVQADILDYLRTLPAESLDTVTCSWGVGYSRPWAVLGQVRRVLRPGGKIAVIDNSLFSLREVLGCSFLAFAEQPEQLQNLMRFRFLTGPAQLAAYFRLLGLRPLWRDGGRRTYTVQSGRAAIERLTTTGAAAGFEFAADEANREAIFARFAEILEDKYQSAPGIPITHRWLAGIARK